MYLLLKNIFTVFITVFLILFIINGFIGLKNSDKYNKSRYDYIFIGSSRVAASINTKIFSNTTSEYLGREVNAINFGRGYTNISHYYYMLKNISEKNIEKLKGVTVFLEAPEGIPISPKSWDFKWAHHKQPEILGKHLDFRGFLRFANESKNDLKEKISVFITMVYKNDPINYVRDRISSGIARLIGGNLNIKKNINIDKIEKAGGIKNDVKDFAKVRSFAISYKDNVIKSQKTLTMGDIENSLFYYLYDYILANNGKLIVYKMPLSDVMRESYLTEIGKKNINLWENSFRKNNVTYLNFKFYCNDSNFPDLWHMDKVTATKFTEELAKQYTKTVLMSSKY